MKSSLGIRTIIAFASLIFGLMFVLPNFSFVQNSPLARFLPQKTINLGLDLRGGIHMTLGVNVDEATKLRLIQTAGELQSLAREKNIPLLAPQFLPNTPANTMGISVILVQQGKQAEFEALLKKEYPSFAIIQSQAHGNGQRYILGYTASAIRELKESALEKTVLVLRSRIDQFGVAEPDIRRQEGDVIQIQLPGMEDPERAKQLIGQTARLEFRLVSAQQKDFFWKGGVPPSNAELLPYVERADVTGSGANQPTFYMAIEKEVLLTGEYIKDAYSGQGREGYEVGIAFNAEGSRIFERVTTDHLHRNLAIVLDGKVHSAPTLKVEIRNGQASITGGFSDKAASDLALVLRAGSLPAPVTILEERTVGPSLGEKSIKQGKLSAYVGGAIVMLFVIVYYGMSGVIAVTMLMFAMLLLMAGMTALGATLTLPGIAGIVLTLGMAVDANVLIYERIREELRRGLTPSEAVEAGFKRASLAITDSNLTSLIVAGILYQFGTGPVRGFAVTLSIGIIVSMYTAVFVARVVFEYWVTMGNNKTHLNI